LENVLAALPVLVSLYLFEACSFTLLAVCLEFALCPCSFVFLGCVVMASLLPG